MTDLLAASVLIGLASYRLWRIIALDQITEPLRAPLIASDSRLIRWVWAMISCAWCLGFWINWVVTGMVIDWQGWGSPEFLLIIFASSTVTGVLARGDE